ncbi:uncharacterized protein J3R85_011724 [Psidium guajava]|nr:uncharacterized protein J3R85_011724 [Psidium guajava]
MGKNPKENLSLSVALVLPYPLQWQILQGTNTSSSLLLSFFHAQVVAPITTPSKSPYFFPLSLSLSLQKSQTQTFFNPSYHFLRLLLYLSCSTPPTPQHL